MTKMKQSVLIGAAVLAVVHYAAHVYAKLDPMGVTVVVFLGYFGLRMFYDTGK